MLKPNLQFTSRFNQNLIENKKNCPKGYFKNGTLCFIKSYTIKLKQ